LSKTVAGDISFTKSVQAATKEYPSERKTDITSPFYFLCLLHLATEHTLHIEQRADEREDWKDFTIRQA
jgi:hypothetical protein